MIRFRVSERGSNSVESIFYTCSCGAENVRGIVKCVDTRPFICWSCQKRLPNVMGMLKNPWMRLHYYREGDSFQREQI
jgi:hypothetical protein